MTPVSPNARTRAPSPNSVSVEATCCTTWTAAVDPALAPIDCSRSRGRNPSTNWAASRHQHHHHARQKIGGSCRPTRVRTRSWCCPRRRLRSPCSGNSSRCRLRISAQFRWALRSQLVRKVGAPAPLTSSARLGLQRVRHHGAVACPRRNRLANSTAAGPIRSGGRVMHPRRAADAAPCLRLRPLSVDRRRMHSLLSVLAALMFTVHLIGAHVGHDEDTSQLATDVSTASHGSQATGAEPGTATPDQAHDSPADESRAEPTHDDPTCGEAAPGRDAHPPAPLCPVLPAVWELEPLASTYLHPTRPEPPHRAPSLVRELGVQRV